MEHLKIRGGKRLNGELTVPSAKNAVLPIIACSILCEDEIIIKNCPKISDVISMLNIIKNLGGKAEYIGHDIHINCSDVNPKLVESDLTGGIRSSIFVLGPILARFHTAEISYPGGCEIGLRPIDLHILGLKALNVKITEENGLIICDGHGMKGGNVHLDFPSVGATENIMMAGVFSNGITVIRNAAREPEIVDLQNFINFMGGKVSGAGSSVITVQGVKKLKGGEYSPISDRIIAGTFLSSVAMCGGEIKLNNVQHESLYSVTEKLIRCGASVEEFTGAVRLKSDGKLKAIHKIETQPFPGFPTDMQAQISAMLTVASGSSVIVENLFENRFKYTAQLVKMGANITVKDRVALIRGVKRLRGASVKAEDLRGGAALVMAGLEAEGDTLVSDIYHIDRGYYKFEQDLSLLGADIKRVSE